MRSLLVSSLCGLALVGCSSSAALSSDATEGAFSSKHADLYDFEFAGELVTTKAAGTEVDVEKAIATQYLFAVGALDPHYAGPWPERMKVLSSTVEALTGDLVKVRYRIRLPIAWQKASPPASTVTLTLPLRMDVESRRAFAQDYREHCASESDVPLDHYWYYYRPEECASGHEIAADRVIHATATVAPSELVRTTGRYPQYDQMWSDDVLEVLAIFGMDKGATADDLGVLEYSAFVGGMKNSLPQATTTPASLPADLDGSVKDITIESTLANGKKVRVVVLLAEGLGGSEDAYRTRVAAVSPGADFIYYGGHSGWTLAGDDASNLLSMTRGKYQMVFIDGCNTFSYMGDALTKRRAEVNAPNDPNGTLFMDVVSNVLPAGFYGDARSPLKMVKALVHAAAPQTFEEMFEGLPRSQLLVVTGEEDNTFRPGH